MHQLVIRRAQNRIAGGGAEARYVDQRLRMLDAKADGKGLGLHIHTAINEHLKRVARTVADGEHHMIGGDTLAVFQHHTAHLSHAVLTGFDLQIGNAVLKAVFPTQSSDGRAHILHHLHKAERADMRMRLGEDFRRRFGLYEFGEHLASQMARVFDLAVELAVGERTRSAFAKLYVGLGVENGFAPQSPGVLRPLPHDFAALQNDGPEPHLREQQRREQPARPRADDDGAQSQMLRRAGGQPVVDVGRGFDVFVPGKAREHGGFVFYLHIQRINQQDVGFFACVMGAAEDGAGEQLLRRDAQFGQHRPGNGFRGMIQRQFDFGQSEHKCVCVLVNGGARGSVFKPGKLRI